MDQATASDRLRRISQRHMSRRPGRVPGQNVLSQRRAWSNQLGSTTALVVYVDAGLAARFPENILPQAVLELAGALQQGMTEADSQFSEPLPAEQYLEHIMPFVEKHYAGTALREFVPDVHLDYMGLDKDGHGSDLILTHLFNARVGPVPA